MFILGIDTSCDDTSASIVENGNKIISNIVSSQNEIHQKYGGIVPELASRRHIEMIIPVVDEAIHKAGVGFDDISAIAVSKGPGLIGSLLVGVCFAKALSFAKNIPLVPINHLEGHIISIFLEASPEFPFLALVVSGGHTTFYIVNGVGLYSELGRTRDDAAGEAFDKVAKLLGFGYPGGPIIDMIAAKGNADAISFPRGLIKDNFDVSFSGLKTAVFNHIRKYPESSREDVAASFQSAVIDILLNRALDSARANKINRIVLSGGVASNSGLRKQLREKALKQGIDVYLPSVHLCTDNAAMIASAGYYHFINEETADYDLNPKAYLPLGSANS
jgi:N6-L-threonylcarbamoyladenine synthase